MALPFLGKKKISGKGYVPTDRIRDLASKGFSEPEIIDVLRKEGFSPEEVDKGLTQSLKITISPSEETSSSQFSVSEGPQLPELPTMENIEAVQSNQQLVVPETSLPHSYPSSLSTEEYIDYLVSQRITEQITDLYYKMQELTQKYNELSEKFDDIKNKMSQVEQQEVKGQQAIFSRIEEFRNTVGDAGSRIGSLERAFKDTLPGLIDSVKTLASLTDRIKKEI